MMKQHTNVSLETIRSLQANGFTCIRFELMNSDDPTKARVEVIPGKGENFDMDSVELKSRDILDYFEEPSPMAEYVINSIYL